jgi:peroxiredoxin
VRATSLLSMNKVTIALLSMAAAATLMAQVLPPKTSLKVGDIAPDFELPSTQGTKVKLSSFLRKKNVVLAFYPAAFTGGCTKEMSGYQANITKFEGADTEVFGISTDNTPSQAEFARKVVGLVIRDAERFRAAQGHSRLRRANAGSWNCQSGDFRC